MRSFILSIFLVIGLGLGAQTVKTSTFIVKGNCDDCKERIENAADIKGVKILKWDVKSKVASVTYDPQKTDLLKIQQAIASAGYDAGEVKGNNKSYAKLPNCCKYRDGKCEE